MHRKEIGLNDINNNNISLFLLFSVNFQIFFKTKILLKIKRLTTVLH